jgi:hypothetical protein
LGFVIGKMHGRPKLRRDKRTGRFVGKPKYFWAGTNVERHLPPPDWFGPKARIKHEVNINSPIDGMSRSRFPGRFVSPRKEAVRRDFDAVLGRKYDGIEIDPMFDGDLHD